MAWLAPVVVVLGAMALILTGRWAAGHTQSARNPVIALNLRYQPIALAIGIVAVGCLALLVPEHANYLAVGDWSAPASGMGWLGVADGDSWASLGLTFLVIATLATTLTVWLQVGRRSRVTAAALLRALPVGAAFAVVNALAEELLFRITLTQSLSGVVSSGTIAIISAVLFALPHWFGNPGRLPGMVLAGFLGWFLALSVVQTGGLGWALVIHGTLDVVIFTILIASAAHAPSKPIMEPVAS